MNMKTEADRLLIRSIQEIDIESLAILWTDPKVTYYMGGPRNYEEVIKSLKEDIQAKRDFDLWSVIEKETDQVIGHCGIIDKEVDSKKEYEIVYVIAKSAWGKGYATEAATGIKDYASKQLGLGRIIALIDPDNTRSERVAVKIGLIYEKDTIRPNGKTIKVYALDFRDY